MSALFFIICGFWVSSLRASLSFLVSLSGLFCLCLSTSSISILILNRNVSSVPLSSVPLSNNLSGFVFRLGFFINGSLFFWLLCFNVLSSYIVLILCMKFLMSLCNICIGKCFGLGINVSPFLKTLSVFLLV